jgi:hypothetical protein
LPPTLVTDREAAAAYVDELGFVLLFPAARTLAPSLWEAVAGPDAEPFETGMGEPESLVWAWKDELPQAGLAWYGKFVHGRGSLLSPRLLAALYRGAGEPDDHAAFDLPAEAHQIADALLAGPLTTAALREIVGDRNRYQRAITALQRQLLVTSAGTSQQRTGWPAGVVELTCRLFEVGGERDDRYVAARFAQTMIEATPAELARAFGWPLAAARSVYPASMAPTSTASPAATPPSTAAE